MSRAEDALQKTIVQYLTLQLPADVYWFHPPNGEHRSKRTAAKLKAMGVQAGVPDLVFVHEGRSYFIELKAPGEGGTSKGKGYNSADQRACHNRLRDAGAAVDTCRSLEEVQNTLAGWGIIAVMGANV